MGLGIILGIKEEMEALISRHRGSSPPVKVITILSIILMFGKKEIFKEIDN